MYRDWFNFGMNWLCALCIHKLYFCIRFFCENSKSSSFFFVYLLHAALRLSAMLNGFYVILLSHFVTFLFSRSFFFSLFFYLSINTHFLSYFQQAMDFHVLYTICYCCALFYALVVVCSLLFKFCLSNLIHKPFHSIVNHVIYTYTLTLTHREKERETQRHKHTAYCQWSSGDNAT